MSVFQITRVNCIKCFFFFQHYFMSVYVGSGETLEIWCEICHACSKPVAWKGAHCCGYGPCTCTLINNPMMMMMMICDFHLYPVFLQRNILSVSFTAEGVT